MRLSKRTIRMLKEVGKKYKFGCSYTGAVIRVTKTGSDKDFCCPITAMAEKTTAVSNPWYLGYAKTLGIPEYEAIQIAEAADKETHPYRPYLMRHLGMVE